MHTISGCFEVQVDSEVNAAVIQFDQFPSDGHVVDIPVLRSGHTIAVVTFSRSGRLVQMQLLAADVQLEGLLSAD